MTDRFPLRVRVLPVAACCVAALSTSAQAVAPTADGGLAPGNVLVLVADDLGVEILASYGPAPSQPPTPTLDQLAADGVRFTRAWGAPLCTPSRASLQTGRHALRTGIGGILGGFNDTTFGPYGLPLAEIALPMMLRIGAPGVYRTACIGKWHLASEDNGGLTSPNAAGYHHYAGPLGNLQPGESYTAWKRVVNGVSAPEFGYATTVQVDDALQFIGHAAEPWFCIVNFTAPHVPFHAPPSELITQDLSGLGSPQEAPREHYNAMVEALDTEIGRLLDGLGPAADDTTVIFLADNGTPSSAAVAPLDATHAKGTFFEGGVRVPLIVHGPAVATPGSVCDALVDVTDVWPTVAELAGVDPGTVLAHATVLDGASLVPYLAEPGLDAQKEFVFTELYRPNGEGAGLPVYFGSGPLCQEDLGFGGPGDLSLSVCGDVLGGDGKVAVALTGAPPNATVFLAGSYLAFPVPLLGGWLVPFPETLVLEGQADASGDFELPPLKSKHGPYTFTFQAAAVDPAQPAGVALSNAVQVEVQPSNVKAVRNERFKLVRMYNGIGPDRLFDLANDPAEGIELLADGELSPEAVLSYQLLSDALDAFLASY